MSLQYLKKEVRDEVDFLHADKHQSFLQGDTVIIDVHDQAFRNVSSGEGTCAILIFLSFWNCFNY